MVRSIGFLIFLLIFGGINDYIGLRGWQWLRTVASIPRTVYWPAFWLLALSFPLSRLAARALPLWAVELAAWVSGYWLAAVVYLLQVLLLIDLVRLLNRWTGLIPVQLIPDVNLLKLTGAAVSLLLVGLLVYGTWRARTPVVTEHAVSIPKSAGPYRELHVVLISDTHLGAINGIGRIRELVAMVNRLEPDLILVAGDIIDDDFRPFLAHNMAAALGRMQSRLGTYGVLGNHDAGSENLAEFRAEMQRAGIHLLVDEWVKVDDSLYVVGRNDRSQRHLTGGRQQPLDQILAGVDPSLPILLMDHQPDRLDEAVAAGVDLQVSGHTHRGQLFPGNLITSRVFAVDWGHLHKQGTHFVVSLGYGTWGPPIRIGNRPEVVSIRVTFGE